MTTLISFIGRGRKDDKLSDVYKSLDYDFGNKQVVRSSCFLRAICESKKYIFDNVLVIGTVTSSWNTLLDDMADGQEELWLDLEEQVALQDGGGVKSESLKNLELVLQKRWRVPVRCIAHEKNLLEDNAFNILDRYFGELSLADRDIILDITHSFRWMPLMLMTAVQYKNSFIGGLEKISIIYGEESGKVRFLDAVWCGIDISNACSLFFGKFEPRPLSKLLLSFWPEGSQAVETIGMRLQGNLVVHLDEVMNQIKNALGKYDMLQAPPEWSKKVYQGLKSMHSNLTKSKELCRQILILAEMFAERHLYGQAIITLRLSYEAFLFLFFEEVNYGDHKLTEELDGKFKKQCLKKHSYKEFEFLKNLDYTRNMIAHGGGQSAENKNSKPKVQNLPGTYDSLKHFLENLYKEKLG